MEEVLSEDEDKLVFWKYDRIVGLTFSDKKTYSFLMRVTYKNKSDVSTYLAEEIASSVSFEDGAIVYPDDKPPTLDREGLEWADDLIDEEIKVVWNEKGSSKGTVHFGKIVSYHKESHTHVIRFDDATTETIDLFDCFSLFSEWQIIPNRAQEKKDTEQEQVAKIARDKRLESRITSKALNDNSLSRKALTLTLHIFKTNYLFL